MTHSIKKTFNILSLILLGSVLLYNCEPDPDTLGEQLFLDGAAQGNETSYDLIAYNINTDTIQSNGSKLGAAVLGAFDEEKFGMQKASFVTQLRLANYNPDFGTNAVVDSVVLVIKPTYATDSLTTTTDENYIYPDGNVAAKKVVNTYPVNKYGKAKLNGSPTTFNIKVHEVTDFLNSSDESFKYSNKVVGFDTTPIGSKVFNGNVNSVTITKDSDNSSIYTSSAVGLRIPLSATFFQDKIIAKKGQPELQDASNFVRYFKGLRISVDETDGYLFSFSPESMELVMYYKYDKTENGTTTKTPASYAFSLGSANLRLGQYQYNRSPTFTQYVLKNDATGDEKLFLQGMGGPSIGVKFPANTINELKKLYQNDKAAIISAKIRIYTDASNWSNKYGNPSAFSFIQKDKDTNGNVTTNFTADVLNLVGSNNFLIYRPFDLDKNQAYYDFTVTKSVKDIVEDGKDYADKYFKIEMGAFLTSSTTGALAGYQYTARPYTRDRAVFIGSDPANAKRIQLKVIYGTK